MGGGKGKESKLAISRHFRKEKREEINGPAEGQKDDRCFGTLGGGDSTACRQKDYGGKNWKPI